MLASNFCPRGEFGLELLVLLPMPPVYCNYNHTAYHTVFYFLSDKQVVLDTKNLNSGVKLYVCQHCTYNETLTY